MGILSALEWLEKRALLKQANRLGHPVGLQFEGEGHYIIAKVVRVGLATFVFNYLAPDEVSWKSTEVMAIQDVHAVVLDSLERARGRLAYQLGEGEAYEASLGTEVFFDFEG